MPSRSSVVKEAAVDAFLAHGWRPNYEYRQRLNERGQFMSATDRSVLWDENYLKSPSGRYAVTLKSLVLTLHDSQRQYCKILSMKYSQVEIRPDGIQCGCILLMFNEGTV